MSNYFAAIAIVLGVFAGYLFRHWLSLRKVGSSEKRANELLRKAREETQQMILQAKKKAIDTLEKVKIEEQERQKQLNRQEERLAVREERIEKDLEEIDRQKKSLLEKVEKIKEIQKNVQAIEKEAQEKLQSIAKLTVKQAKEKVMTMAEKENEEIITELIKKLEKHKHEEIDQKAADLIAQSMQRIVTSQAEEFTTTTVAIKDEDVKGRIIGKEGRNIRTFQKATGVELIIDETPDAVVISSFSPLRRQIAKVALERLIIDGRIQPARIEEIVTKVKEEFTEKIRQLGEEAVYELGIADFDPQLVYLIGMLYFRTSFGQNILRHSIEVAGISAIMAEELGANVGIAKRAAILHDIGKAVSHEVEGSHVEIGKKILEKFKVDQKIIDAVISHHEDYPFTDIESRVIQVADALSASRPGVRRENYEAYIKRLEELESLSNNFDGVKKTYAIQAGREIRVFVDAEKISDLEAYQLAKKIAEKIEKEMVYPGEIKVNVIRETRAIEFAR
ncbi:MAG: ribonuclease Y [Candidatus Paceibacterota bacterium]|jgi:ribonuclease Y